MEALVTAEQDGEWVRQTIERLTGLENIWVKPDLEETDPGWHIIQGLELRTFWVSYEAGARREEADLRGYLTENGWPLVAPKDPEPLVQTNDFERDKRIWAEGFLRALAMLQEAYPAMSWPEYYVTEELEANPYATPQPPSGKLLEALQDRDALLGALGPYALQVACTAHPDAVDYEGCGKCHNCRARALYSPIIKWIRKGYRRAPTSA